MNRRTFFWTVGSLSAMALLSSSAGNLLDLLNTSSIPVRRKYAKKLGEDIAVSVAWLKKDESCQESFEHMLNLATDFSWFSKNDKVLIKLSLNSALPYPATSDPWALECLIKLLREKGASKILVGDQSGVHSVYWTKNAQRGSSRRCCRSSGLLSVIEKNGAIPCFFEERGYNSYSSVFPAGNHHWKQPLFISNVVNEVDHIIYLPRVSAHVISDITSGLKIGVGFLREDSRRVMHSGGEDFFARYEEINEVPAIKSKLRLIISSGRSVISLWGPDDGYITEPEYGNVFASENLLAHELYAYAWLQYNREMLTPRYLYGLEQGMRSLVNMRSRGNRSFVKKIWQSDQDVPDIPAYQPGDIYLHPSIVNNLQRLGGSHSNIIVKELNHNPDLSVREYLQKQLCLPL